MTFSPGISDLLNFKDFNVMQLKFGSKIFLSTTLLSLVLQENKNNSDILFYKRKIFFLINFTLKQTICVKLKVENFKRSPV